MFGLGKKKGPDPNSEGEIARRMELAISKIQKHLGCQKNLSVCFGDNARLDTLIKKFINGTDDMLMSALGILYSLAVIKKTENDLLNARLASDEIKKIYE